MARLKRQRGEMARVNTTRRGNGRPPPSKRPPEAPSRQHPRHGKLPSTGAVLAEQLGRVAVRTLYAALTRNARMYEVMKAAKKDTAEFRALRDSEVPEEVRAWVRDHFWKTDDPVMRAVVSEMAVALTHALPAPKERPEDLFTCAPRHLQPSKYDNDFDPEGAGPLTNPPPLSCCSPMCGGP